MSILDEEKIYGYEDDDFCPDCGFEDCICDEDDEDADDEED